MGGKDDGDTYEEVKCFMIHSILKDRLPQTYGLFLNEEIIGMYQFSYEDLSIRPDIYPWLANVYIDEKYRNNGYCRKMMETVKTNAKIIWILKKYTCIQNILGFTRNLIGNIFQILILTESVLGYKDCIS